jgi:hypothetical protein
MFSRGSRISLNLVRYDMATAFPMLARMTNPSKVYYVCAGVFLCVVDRSGDARSAGLICPRRMM